MPKFNFGVIGIGNIGKRHVEKIFDHTNSELVAVCDTNENRIKELNFTGDVTKYKNYQEMISRTDIDVISICTPNYLHSVMTIDSLNSGKHVVCEKPMALNVREAQDMISSSLKNNKHLFVVKQNRHNPPISKIKELIESGKLGKIFSVSVNCYWNRNRNYYNSDWKGKKDKDGGVLFTQYSHFIDLLYYLFGDVEEVDSYISNYSHPYIEIEDSGVVILKFHNGAIGTLNYTINSFAKNMEGSITIFTEYGTVKIGGQYLNELEYYKIDGIDSLELPVSAGPNDYGDYVGTMSNHHLVYKNVIDTLLGKDKILVNGIDGLKTVEIIEKIYKAKK